MKNTYYNPQAFDPSAAPSTTLRASANSGQAFSALQQFTIVDYI